MLELKIPLQKEWQHFITNEILDQKRKMQLQQQNKKANFNIIIWPGNRIMNLSPRSPMSYLLNSESAAVAGSGFDLTGEADFVNWGGGRR